MTEIEMPEWLAQLHFLPWVLAARTRMIVDQFLSSVPTTSPQDFENSLCFDQPTDDLFGY